MSSNMLAVDLKITLDTIQRRFSLPTPCPAWEDLAALVKDGFELPERFKLGLCYKDQDGEYITVSSTKELASIWPTVTADDERDLDALPPLRFSVVNIPSHMDSHGFHGHLSAHLGHGGRHTRFGEHWFGQHMDGPGAHDGPEPPKDGPKPPKHPKDGEKDNLKEDVHRFIEAVKHNVTDNKEVQDAYTKLIEHARSEHGPKKPKEGAAANVFGEVAMQTDSSDGLTSGIVAAMLTPAFLGPPPPPPHHGGPHRRGPHGGPPHGPPPHGRPPHGPSPHHGGPPHEPPHHGPPHHGPPGRSPHHRPGFGFGPGHGHPRGPGGPPRGPGGPPRGPGRDHDEFGPPPPHDRFGPGPGRPYGRHGGPFDDRRGGHEHHGRWGPEGPGRRFRGHPYYAHPSSYRRQVDEDTEPVGSLDSDFELDSDIEDITQGVREMHRNTGVF